MYVCHTLPFPFQEEKYVSKQNLMKIESLFLFQNLTGGKDGGIHITDVTNASRTMLMNIETLQWDPLLCRFVNCGKVLFPENASVYIVCIYREVTAYSGYLLVYSLYKDTLFCFQASEFETLCYAERSVVVYLYSHCFSV